MQEPHIAVSQVLAVLAECLRMVSMVSNETPSAATTAAGQWWSLDKAMLQHMQQSGGYSYGMGDLP
jgi:hypothetical protein